MAELVDALDSKSN